ncbi:MAG: nuclear transport factor 2 family protein [Candidatus Dormibacteria bacterium]
MTADPQATVLGFDALWNAHDRDTIVAMLADDSVVDLNVAPPPPGRARYEGRAGVTEFVDQFIPGFHVSSQNFGSDGDEVVWDFTVSNDMARTLGVDHLTGTGRLLQGDGGRLRHFGVTFDDATIERIAAVLAAA